MDIQKEFEERTKSVVKQYQDYLKADYDAMSHRNDKDYSIFEKETGAKKAEWLKSEKDFFDFLHKPKTELK